MASIAIRTAREIEQERLAFKAPRYGHNNYGIEPTWSRINYMAHGQGYVMARRPRGMPFVISEKLWLSFVPWNGLVHGER